MRYTYPAKFIPEEEGFSIFFPDLEGVLSQGDDFDQAVEMATEALELGIMDYLENGLEPPRPNAFEGCVPISVEIDEETVAIP